MNQTKLLILVTILIILVISIWLAKRNGVSAAYQPEIKEKQHIDTDTTLDSPIDFGYKTIWIAVKTSNKERLAELLNLTKIQSSNWKSGIEFAYDGGVFITPQIGEWTLAVGYSLANTDDSLGIHKLERTLNLLSNEFEEAHSFATHRIVEYHHWIKSINGKIQRTYVYLGESGENIKVYGVPTPAEENLNLFNSFSPEAKEESYWDREDVTTANEELVMRIAEQWSVNPSKLSERNDIKKELGIILE